MTKIARRDAQTAVPGPSIAKLQEQLDIRTRERDEALEQQAATAEVLKVISSSTGKLEPVFLKRRRRRRFQFPSYFRWKTKDVALICLCYLEHATSAQLHYTSRRLRRKAAGVPTLVCIFNEAGQTHDGDPQQLPESVEFLQGFCLKA